MLSNVRLVSPVNVPVTFKLPILVIAPEEIVLVTSNVGAVILCDDVQLFVEESHVNFLSVLLFNIKPAPLI